MRRISIFFAVAAACVFVALGLVVTSSSSSRSSKVGGPNFICISTPSFGICIGPPTKKG